MTSFTRLTDNALREAQKASRRPGQRDRFIEQASLQAATVYAILDLKGTLEEVLTELQDLKSKE